MIAAEEDLITFSPTPLSPRISSTKHQSTKFSFVEGLLDHIHRAHAQALSQISKKVDPFIDDSDEDNDPDEHQRLLNRPVGQLQPVSAMPSALAPKLLQQPSEHIGDSDVVPSGFHHEYPVASPSPIREAPFPPISSTGCVVTIHNLPSDIAMRDILARVSGGEIRTASLVKLKKTMCAVITFKEGRSAQQFVHTSRSFNDEIWSFKCHEEGADSANAQIAYAPTLDTSKLFNDPIDIPMKPRYSMEIDFATRCLAITNCSFELIEEIWNALRLPYLLKYPNCINQFEDIWLDSFQRGSDGRIESTTMHIWYTSTNMAVGAKELLAGRYWSKNIRYEADPCDDTPAVLFFRPSDDAGFAWNSNPHHSLLNVYNAECIGELFRTWHEIAEAVKKARAAPSKPKEGPKLLPSEDMAARRKAALTNGGFDPVTLISMSSQDYDSDDEGGRGPPRIDTRKIEAQQAALRKNPLLSRTACLTALTKLAAKAPSTSIYSPGTSTVMPTVHDGLDDESEYSDCSFQGHDDNTHEDACKVPINPLAIQRHKSQDAKTVVRSNPKQSSVYSEERLARLKKAFKEPMHWYTVSVAEFVACNEQQHKAMGTVFYVPPEGHNSLRKHAWADDSPPRFD